MMWGNSVAPAALTTSACQIMSQSEHNRICRVRGRGPCAHVGGVTIIHLAIDGRCGRVDRKNIRIDENASALPILGNFWRHRIDDSRYRRIAELLPGTSQNTLVRRGVGRSLWSRLRSRHDHARIGMVPRNKSIRDIAYSGTITGMVLRLFGGDGAWIAGELQPSRGAAEERSGRNFVIRSSDGAAFFRVGCGCFGGGVGLRCHSCLKAGGTG